MSALLSLDPGKKSVGWAILRDGEPVSAGTWPGDELSFLRIKAHAKATTATRWAIEDAEPVGVYLLRQKRSTPEAIIALCRCCGVLREACEAAGLGRPVLVKPQQWKAIHGGGASASPERYRAWLHRLWPALGLDEMEPDAAAAVGVGLWTWPRVMG